MEKNNDILEYLEDIMYFQRHEDKEGLEALLREGEHKSVTMRDVALTLMDIITDLTDYIDESIIASQKLNEERLRAIAECFDYDTLQYLKSKFDEAEDDLFIEEGEEQNNE